MSSPAATRSRTASVVVFLLVCAGAARTQDVPARPAMLAMAATCAACHGTDGRAVAGEAMPRLAGQPREALAASLRAFRDGSRPATVMHQLAKGYTNEEIEALAAYFAAMR